MGESWKRIRLKLAYRSKTAFLLRSKDRKRKYVKYKRKHNTHKIMPAQRHGPRPIPSVWHYFDSPYFFAGHYL
jgi:hypothetical protein